MHDDSTELDLFSVPTQDGPELEHLPNGQALGTFSTTSSATTASCPFSSASSVMTAGSSG